MTLQSSGAISIANINTELGVASTTTRSLNDSAARTLAGVASGTISMSNFYGKSNAPAVTFTPNGGTSAGSPVSLYNYGAGGAAVTVTISCSTAATWTITRTGSSTGANYPTGTYNSLSSLVLSLSNNSTSIRSTQWVVSGTAGGVTRYWVVTIDNDGLV